MRDYIRERVVQVANYIYETKATVRQAAKIFGVSKSTVHKDVTERLEKVDEKLAERVRKVLEFNKAERHIRGGEATKRKYLEEEVGGNC
ncbi:MAG: sporulation transcriptional regulator SpoIIID [Halanaerobium sp.]|nr:sporulation transcriptional regulator SpoIIID [Halanaerobium sp.]